MGIRRYNIFLKVTATIVALIFFHQQIVWAAGDISSYPKINKNFNIPKNLADIEKKGLLGKNETIINIQDCHSSLSAQYSIVEILKNLMSEYDVRVVAVEGASGYIDTSLLKTLPDEKLREETADYLMKEGKISAGEFFTATQDEDIALYGVEDNSLYQENLKVFREIFRKNRGSLVSLNKLLAALKEKEDKTYSGELSRMVFKSRLHRKGKISFDVYWDFLEKLCKEKGIPTESYPNIKAFIDSVYLEKEVDFSKATDERTLLINRISKSAVKEDLEQIAIKSLYFEKGRIDQAVYHGWLVDFAQKRGVDCGEYKELLRFVDYTRKYHSLDVTGLQNELDQLEEKVFSELFTGKEERELYEATNFIELLKSLFQIQLTDCEAEDLREMIGKIKVDGLSETILEEAKKALKFYELAEKRNSAMLANTVASMRRERKRVAALISGGHHSEGLTDLMKEKGLSYLVLMPKFSGDNIRPYVAILTKKTGPYRELVKAGEYDLALEAYLDTGDFTALEELIVYALGKCALEGKDLNSVVDYWADNYEAAYNSIPKERLTAVEYDRIDPEIFRLYLGRSKAEADESGKTCRVDFDGNIYVVSEGEVKLIEKNSAHEGFLKKVADAASDVIGEVKEKFTQKEKVDAAAPDEEKPSVFEEPAIPEEKESEQFAEEDQGDVAEEEVILEEPTSAEDVKKLIKLRARGEYALLGTYIHDIAKEYGETYKDVTPVSPEFIDACIEKSLFDDGETIRHKERLYDEFFTIWSLIQITLEDAKTSKEEAKKKEPYFTVVNDVEINGESYTRIIVTTQNRTGCENYILEKLKKLNIYYEHLRGMVYDDVAISVYHLQQNAETREVLSENKRKRLLQSFEIVDLERTKRSYKEALSLTSVYHLEPFERCNSNGIPGGVWNAVIFNYETVREGELHFDESIMPEEYEINEENIDRERIHLDSILKPLKYQFQEKIRKAVGLVNTDQDKNLLSLISGLNFELEKGNPGVTYQMKRTYDVFKGLSIGHDKGTSIRNIFARILITLAEGYRVSDEDISTEQQKLVNCFSVARENDVFGHINEVKLAAEAIESAKKKMEEHNYTARFAIWEWLSEKYPIAEGQRRRDEAALAERVVNKLSVELDIEDVAIEGLREIVEQAREEDREIVVVSRDMVRDEIILRKMTQRYGIKYFVSCHGSMREHVAILATAAGAMLLVDLPEVIFDDFCATGEPAAISSVSMTKTEQAKFLAGNPRTKKGWDMVSEVITSQTMKDYYVEKERELRKKRTVAKTRDGVEVSIYGNIILPAHARKNDNGYLRPGAADIVEELYNDFGANGVALVRTEYAFNRKAFLEFERQREVYLSVANVADKEVAIRTFDKEHDKKCIALPDIPGVYGFGYYKEPEGREVLKIQIMAIFVAYAQSRYKNLKMMIPMIKTVDDMKFLGKLIDEVKEEIVKKYSAIEKEVLNGMPVGIMVETEEVIKDLDAILDQKFVSLSFLSIGSNDLTSDVKKLPRHDLKDSHFDNEMLKILEKIVKAAKARDLDVSICGDHARFDKTIIFSIYLYKKHGVLIVPGVIQGLVPKLKTEVEFTDAETVAEMLKDLKLSNTDESNEELNKIVTGKALIRMNRILGEELFNSILNKKMSKVTPMTGVKEDEEKEQGPEGEGPDKRAGPSDAGALGVFAFPFVKSDISTYFTNPAVLYIGIIILITGAIYMIYRAKRSPPEHVQEVIVQSARNIAGHIEHDGWLPDFEHRQELLELVKDFIKDPFLSPGKTTIKNALFEAHSEAVAKNRELRVNPVLLRDIPEEDIEAILLHEMVHFLKVQVKRQKAFDKHRNKGVLGVIRNFLGYFKAVLSGNIDGFTKRISTSIKIAAAVATHNEFEAYSIQNRYRYEQAKAKGYSDLKGYLKYLGSKTNDPGFKEGYANLLSIVYPGGTLPEGYKIDLFEQAIAPGTRKPVYFAAALEGKSDPAVFGNWLFEWLSDPEYYDVSQKRSGESGKISIAVMAVAFVLISIIATLVFYFAKRPISQEPVKPSAEISKESSEDKKIDISQKIKKTSEKQIKEAEPAGPSPIEGRILKLTGNAINHIEKDGWTFSKHTKEILKLLYEFKKSRLEVVNDPSKPYILQTDENRGDIVRINAAFVGEYSDPEIESAIVHEIVHMLPHQNKRAQAEIEMGEKIAGIKMSEFLQKTDESKKLREDFKKFIARKMQNEYEAYSIQNEYRKYIAEQKGFSGLKEYFEHCAASYNRRSPHYSNFKMLANFTSSDGKLLEAFKMELIGVSYPQQYRSLLIRIAIFEGVNPRNNSEVINWMLSWLTDPEYYEVKEKSIDKAAMLPGGTSRTLLLLSLLSGLSFVDMSEPGRGKPGTQPRRNIMDINDSELLEIIPHELNRTHITRLIRMFDIIWPLGREDENQDDLEHFQNIFHKFIIAHAIGSSYGSPEMAALEKPTDNTLQIFASNNIVVPAEIKILLDEFTIQDKDKKPVKQSVFRDKKKAFDVIDETVFGYGHERDFEIRKLLKRMYIYFTAVDSIEMGSDYLRRVEVRRLKAEEEKEKESPKDSFSFIRDDLERSGINISEYMTDEAVSALTDSTLHEYGQILEITDEAYEKVHLPVALVDFTSERGPETRMAVAKYDPSEARAYPVFQKNMARSWGMLRDKATMHFKYQLEGGEVQDVDDIAPDYENARKDVWDIERHLEEFRKDYPNFEIIGFTGNGNILANAHLASYVDGRLHAVEAEKELIYSGNSRVYPSLVIWKDGHISIEEVRFTGGERIIEESTGKDITGEVVSTNSGIGILKNGRPYDLAEHYEHDYDVRHYLDFPFIPDGKISFGVSHFYDETGKVIKDLIVPAIEEKLITLKLEEREAPLTDDQIKQLDENLREEKHYIKAEAASEVKYGVYFLDKDNNELTIGLKRGINPHNICAIDKDGNLVSIIVEGKSNRIGITFKEAQQRLEKMGITDAIIFDNGADAMMNIDGQFIIRSFQGRDRFLSLLVFAKGKYDIMQMNREQRLELCLESIQTEETDFHMEHVARASRMAELIARRIGLSDRLIEILMAAGEVHDGKVLDPAVVNDVKRYIGKKLSKEGRRAFFSISDFYRFVENKKGGALTSEEKNVARDFYDHGTRSAEDIKSLGVKMPLEVELLIKYHQFPSEFFASKDDSRGKLPITPEELGLLLTILFTADVFENGNNVDKMNLFHEGRPFESFEDSFKFLEKKYYEEGIEDRRALEALAKLISEKDGQLLSLAAYARHCSEFLPEDIKFMETQRQKDPPEIPPAHPFTVESASLWGKIMAMLSAVSFAGALVGILIGLMVEAHVLYYGIWTGFAVLGAFFAVSAGRFLGLGKLARMALRGYVPPTPGDEAFSGDEILITAIAERQHDGSIEYHDAIRNIVREKDLSKIILHELFKKEFWGMFFLMPGFYTLARLIKRNRLKTEVKVIKQGDFASLAKDLQDLRGKISKKVRKKGKKAELREHRWESENISDTFLTKQYTPARRRNTSETPEQRDRGGYHFKLEEDGIFFSQVEVETQENIPQNSFEREHYRDAFEILRNLSGETLSWTNELAADNTKNLHFHLFKLDDPLPIKKYELEPLCTERDGDDVIFTVKGYPDTENPIAVFAVNGRVDNTGDINLLSTRCYDVEEIFRDNGYTVDKIVTVNKEKRATVYFFPKRHGHAKYFTDSKSVEKVGPVAMSGIWPFYRKGDYKKFKLDDIQRIFSNINVLREKHEKFGTICGEIKRNFYEAEGTGLLPPSVYFDLSSIREDPASEIKMVDLLAEKGVSRVNFIFDISRGLLDDEKKMDALKELLGHASKKMTVVVSFAGFIENIDEVGDKWNIISSKMTKYVNKVSFKVQKKSEKLERALDLVKKHCKDKNVEIYTCVSRVNLDEVRDLAQLFLNKNMSSIKKFEWEISRDMETRYSLREWEYEDLNHEMREDYGNLRKMEFAISGREETNLYVFRNGDLGVKGGRLGIRRFANIFDQKTLLTEESRGIYKDITDKIRIDHTRVLRKSAPAAPSGVRKGIINKIEELYNSHGLVDLYPHVLLEAELAEKMARRMAEEKEFQNEDILTLKLAIFVHHLGLGPRMGSHRNDFLEIRAALKKKYPAQKGEVWHIKGAMRALIKEIGAEGLPIDEQFERVCKEIAKLLKTPRRKLNKLQQEVVWSVFGVNTFAVRMLEATDISLPKEIKKDVRMLLFNYGTYREFCRKVEEDEMLIRMQSSINPEKMKQLVSIIRIANTAVNRFDPGVREDLRRENPDSIPEAIKFIIQDIEKNEQAGEETLKALSVFLNMLKDSRNNPLILGKLQKIFASSNDQTKFKNKMFLRFLDSGIGLSPADAKEIIKRYDQYEEGITIGTYYRWSERSLIIGVVGLVISLAASFMIPGALTAVPALLSTFVFLSGLWFLLIAENCKKAFEYWLSKEWNTKIINAVLAGTYKNGEINDLANGLVDEDAKEKVEDMDERMHIFLVKMAKLMGEKFLLGRELKAANLIFSGGEFLDAKGLGIGPEYLLLVSKLVKWRHPDQKEVIQRFIETRSGRDLTQMPKEEGKELFGQELEKLYRKYYGEEDFLKELFTTIFRLTIEALFDGGKLEEEHFRKIAGQRIGSRTRELVIARRRPVSGEVEIENYDAFSVLPRVVKQIIELQGLYEDPLKCAIKSSFPYYKISTREKTIAKHLNKRIVKDMPMTSWETFRIDEARRAQQRFDDQLNTYVWKEGDGIALVGYLIEDMKDVLGKLQDKLLKVMGDPKRLQLTRRKKLHFTITPIEKNTVQSTKDKSGAMEREALIEKTQNIVIRAIVERKTGLRVNFNMKRITLDNVGNIILTGEMSNQLLDHVRTGLKEALIVPKKDIVHITIGRIYDEKITREEFAALIEAIEDFKKRTNVIFDFEVGGLSRDLPKLSIFDQAQKGTDEKYRDIEISDDIRRSVTERISISEIRRTGIPKIFLAIKDIFYDAVFLLKPFIEKKSSTRDLKGSKAEPTDPIIEEIIRSGNMIEVFEKNGHLAAYKVPWIGGYIPGLVKQKDALGKKMNVGELFTDEQQDNMIDWIHKHSIPEGRPLRFRIALSKTALAWRNDLEHSNITHAGYRDGCIYIGKELLASVFNSPDDPLRKAILDEDEYKHLVDKDFNCHADEKAYRERLAFVGERIKAIIDSKRAFPPLPYLVKALFRKNIKSSFLDRNFYKPVSNEKIDPASNMKKRYLWWRDPYFKKKKGFLYKNICPFCRENAERGEDREIFGDWTLTANPNPIFFKHITAATATHIEQDSVSVDLCLDVIGMLEELKNYDIYWASRMGGSIKGHLHIHLFERQKTWLFGEEEKFPVEEYPVRVISRNIHGEEAVTVATEYPTGKDPIAAFVISGYVYEDRVLLAKRIFNVETIIRSYGFDVDKMFIKDNKTGKVRVYLYPRSKEYLEEFCGIQNRRIGPVEMSGVFVIPDKDPYLEFTLQEATDAMNEVGLSFRNPKVADIENAIRQQVMEDKELVTVTGRETKDVRAVIFDMDGILSHDTLDAIRLSQVHTYSEIMDRAIDEVYEEAMTFYNENDGISSRELIARLIDTAPKDNREKQLISAEEYYDDYVHRRDVAFQALLEKGESLLSPHIPEVIERIWMVPDRPDIYIASSRGSEFVMDFIRATGLDRYIDYANILSVPEEKTPSERRSIKLEAVREVKKKKGLSAEQVVFIDDSYSIKGVLDGEAIIILALNKYTDKETAVEKSREIGIDYVATDLRPIPKLLRIILGRDKVDVEEVIEIYRDDEDEIKQELLLDKRQITYKQTMEKLIEPRIEEALKTSESIDIAIVGDSATGKTTTASILMARDINSDFGILPVVISTDNFLLDRSERPRDQVTGSPTEELLDKFEFKNMLMSYWDHLSGKPIEIFVYDETLRGRLRIGMNEEGKPVLFIANNRLFIEGSHLNHRIRFGETNVFVSEYTPERIVINVYGTENVIHLADGIIKFVEIAGKKQPVKHIKEIRDGHDSGRFIMHAKADEFQSTGDFVEVKQIIEPDQTVYIADGMLVLHDKAFDDKYDIKLFFTCHPDITFERSRRRFHMRVGNLAYELRERDYIKLLTQRKYSEKERYSDPIPARETNKDMVFVNTQTIAESIYVLYKEGKLLEKPYVNILKDKLGIDAYRLFRDLSVTAANTEGSLGGDKENLTVLGKEIVVDWTEKQVNRALLEYIENKVLESRLAKLEELFSNIWMKRGPPGLYWSKLFLETIPLYDSQIYRIISAIHEIFRTNPHIIKEQSSDQLLDHVTMDVLNYETHTILPDQDRKIWENYIGTLKTLYVGEDQSILAGLVARSKKLNEKAKYLGVCPMSKDIVKAYFEVCDEEGLIPTFIVTPRQVDTDRGYTGFNQEGFVDYLHNASGEAGYDGPIIIERDHGGPYENPGHFKLSLDEAIIKAKETYRADIAAGFNVLHIDCSYIDEEKAGVKLTPTDIAEYTADFMEDCENYRRGNGIPPVAYEIGSDDPESGLSDLEKTESFVKILRKKLIEKKLGYVWDNVIYLVVDTGTRLQAGKQAGKFDIDVQRAADELASKYGLYLKQHEADYLEDSDLDKMAEPLIMGVNVGPEFAKAEYEALEWLERQINEKTEAVGGARSNFMETVREKLAATDRWQRWFEGAVSFEDLTDEQKRLACLECGRYVQMDEEVIRARNRLYDLAKELSVTDDPEDFVIGEIKRGISRFVQAFEPEYEFDPEVVGPALSSTYEKIHPSRSTEAKDEEERGDDEKGPSDGRVSGNEKGFTIIGVLAATTGMASAGISGLVLSSPYFRSIAFFLLISAFTAIIAKLLSDHGDAHIGGQPSIQQIRLSAEAINTEIMRWRNSTEPMTEEEIVVKQNELMRRIKQSGISAETIGKLGWEKLGVRLQLAVNKQRDLSWQRFINAEPNTSEFRAIREGIEKIQNVLNLFDVFTKSGASLKLSLKEAEERADQVQRKITAIKNEYDVNDFTVDSSIIYKIDNKRILARSNLIRNVRLQGLAEINSILDEFEKVASSSCVRSMTLDDAADKAAEVSAIIRDLIKEKCGFDDVKHSLEIAKIESRFIRISQNLQQTIRRLEQMSDDETKEGYYPPGPRKMLDVKFEEPLFPEGEISDEDFDDYNRPQDQRGFISIKLLITIALSLTGVGLLAILFMNVHRIARWIMRSAEMSLMRTAYYGDLSDFLLGQEQIPERLDFIRSLGSDEDRKAADHIAKVYGEIDRKPNLKKMEDEELFALMKNMAETVDLLKKYGQPVGENVVKELEVPEHISELVEMMDELIDMIRTKDKDASKIPSPAEKDDKRFDREKWILEEYGKLSFKIGEFGFLDTPESIREFRMGYITAIHNLGERGGKRSEEKLMKVISTENDEGARLAAVNALSKINTQSSRDFLTELFEDRNEDVRKAAEKAFRNMEKELTKEDKKKDLSESESDYKNVIGLPKSLYRILANAGKLTELSEELPEGTLLVNIINEGNEDLMIREFEEKVIGIKSINALINPDIIRQDASVDEVYQELKAILTDFTKKARRDIERMINPWVSDLTEEDIEEINNINKLEKIIAVLVNTMPGSRSYKLSEKSTRDMRINTIHADMTAPWAITERAEKYVTEGPENDEARYISISARSAADMRFIARSIRDMGINKEKASKFIQVRLLDENVKQGRLEDWMKATELDECLDMSNVVIVSSEDMTLERTMELVKGRFDVKDASEVAIADTENLLVSQADFNILKQEKPVYVQMQGSGIVSQLFFTAMEIIANDGKIPASLGRVVQKQGYDNWYVYLPNIEKIDIDRIKKEKELYEQIIIMA